MHQCHRVGHTLKENDLLSQQVRLSMRIHILGICGTFMGSLALLARDLGHEVTGSDAAVYPPMSTQLQAAGITLCESYTPAHLQPHPDLVIIGNALSRGNAAIEYVLNAEIPYTSGPAWLASEVLRGRHVIAVAGTHGKTTTSTMLAWVLEQAGLQPGYLIGGVPQGLGQSACLGKGHHFVVEADEYDTAFFDKRSKFVHYRPLTAILNNLEYDHADIFPDLAAIQTQFHHLIRTVPGRGLVIWPEHDEALQTVLQRGVWSRQELVSSQDGAVATWSLGKAAADGSAFEILHQGQVVGQIVWTLTGLHNQMNALVAVAAAADCGVEPAKSIAALSVFKGVKRRMELLGHPRGIFVYDDFAHHPTAIATTLTGLRSRLGAEGRIVAVIEPRSNTMRLGTHQHALSQSVAQANQVFWFRPEHLDWDLEAVLTNSPVPAEVLPSIDKLLDRLETELKPGDHVVIMSNGGFAGLHRRLLERLAQPK